MQHVKARSAKSMLHGMASMILVRLIRQNFRANVLWGDGSTIRALTEAFLQYLPEAEPDLTHLLVFAQDTWGKLCRDALPVGDPRTFELWFERQFFDPLSHFGFKPSNGYFPWSPYPAHHIARPGDQLGLYDDLIETKGGLDVALIVPGPGGHVAFAESLYAAADRWLKTPTICCALTEESRNADVNYPGCNGDLNVVPYTALTITPGTLMRVLNPGALLVVGAMGSKNMENVLHMLCGDIGPEWPISFVRAMERERPDVEVVVFTEPESRLMLQG